MSNIIFKKLSSRNFLSVGSAGLEYNLDQNHLTLVLGKNGAGKSGPLIDALCFALYGKPYRDINKAMLINTLNNKDMQVELELTVNGVEYKIIRGMKPGVFEIWCNGQLVNQDADSRDYQKLLENQILKMSYKTFTQVVVIGPAAYKPFMELKAGERREVIEELLDIKVFAVMSQLLKSKMDQLKTKLDTIDVAMKSKKESLARTEALIEKFQQDKSAEIASLDEQLEQLNSNVLAFEKQQTALTAEIEQAGDVNVESLISKSKELQLYKTKIMGNIRKTHERKHFLESSGTCPTCTQPIERTNVQPVLDEADRNLEEFNKAVNVLDNKMLGIDAAIKEARAVSTKVTELTSKLSEVHTQLQVTHGIINNTEKQKSRLLRDDTNIDQLTTHCSELAKQVMEYLSEKRAAQEEKSIQEVSQYLLKDSGIRTTIINKYLPLLNNLINRNLEAMDLFVSFELDDQFNETVKSRHRDNFSFASFSEGEKARLNVAILFAWRELARQRASVWTNLLVLDEVLDQSMDYEGISGAMGLMYDMKGTNVWLISHNPIWADKFPNHITLTKNAGYTVLETRA